MSERRPEIGSEAWLRANLAQGRGTDECDRGDHAAVAVSLTHFTQKTSTTQRRHDEARQYE